MRREHLQTCPVTEVSVAGIALVGQDLDAVRLAGFCAPL